MFIKELLTLHLPVHHLLLGLGWGQNGGLKDSVTFLTLLMLGLLCFTKIYMSSLKSPLMLLSMTIIDKN